jgi:hypothetical protein
MIKYLLFFLTLFVSKFAFADASALDLLKAVMNSDALAKDTATIQVANPGNYIGPIKIERTAEPRCYGCYEYTVTDYTGFSNIYAVTAINGKIIVNNKNASQ